jgi:alanyl-tRNA synthetase
VENHPVRTFTTSLEHARDLGATALFGEKYGEFVRVVEIDDFSRELCGGTHVGWTSEVGAFKILAESSVGANVRRIEAVSGRAAVSYYRDRDLLVSTAASTIGVTEDQLLPGLSRLQDRVSTLEAELAGFVSRAAKDVVASLAEEAAQHKGVSIVASVIEVRDMDHLLSLVDQVRERTQPSVVALGAEIQGKGALIVSVSSQVDGVDAGQVVKTASRAFGGGGGGTTHLGRGGGGDPRKLQEAIVCVRETVLASLSE